MVITKLQTACDQWVAQNCLLVHKVTTSAQCINQVIFTLIILNLNIGLYDVFKILLCLLLFADLSWTLGKGTVVHILPYGQQNIGDIYSRELELWLFNIEIYISPQTKKIEYNESEDNHQQQWI
jgi:hypothetical protein